MDPNLTAVAVLGASLGVVSHVGYFIRGEFVKSAPRLFILALLIPPSLACFLFTYVQLSLVTSIKTTVVGYGAYLFALYTSIVTYRLWFHPLRHFPGPKLAPITQFYHAHEIAFGDNHFYLRRLHSRYGDFVRVGPNLLSIADPDWVEPVHNRQTHFRKGDWYDLGRPKTSLQQMRDTVLHDKRRRHGWDNAFRTASLRAYDSRVTKYTDILVDQLHKREGQSVNATYWFNSFAFDVMGDLTFGRAFQALESGKSHPVIDALHVANKSGRALNTMIWILEILVEIMPVSLTGFGTVLAYGDKYVKERQTYEPDEPDIMSHILKAGQFYPDKKLEEDILKTDSRLLIIAGSDTTSAALTYVHYHLAHDSSVVEKLRKELNEHNITSGKDCNVQKLQDLPYLNAVINEALRIHPPVPGGFLRETPPEGTNINGHFLPGGVRLLTPPYVIQRSPKAFLKPDEFIPERWTTRPELILKKEAFFPFLIGRFSCIGKQLALNELRLVIARIVLQFDIDFAENEDGRAVLEDSMDCNTMVLADLNLRFSSRK